MYKKTVLILIIISILLTFGYVGYKVLSGPIYKTTNEYAKLYPVNIDGNDSYVNEKGELVIAPSSVIDSFYNGYYIVYKNNEQLLIDLSTNKEVASGETIIRIGDTYFYEVSTNKGDFIFDTRNGILSESLFESYSMQEHELEMINVYGLIDDQYYLLSAELQKVTENGYTNMYGYYDGMVYFNSKNEEFNNYEIHLVIEETKQDNVVYVSEGILSNFYYHENIVIFYDSGTNAGGLYNIVTNELIEVETLFYPFFESDYFYIGAYDSTEIYDYNLLRILPEYTVQKPLGNDNFVVENDNGIYLYNTLSKDFNLIGSDDLDIFEDTFGLSNGLIGITKGSTVDFYLNNKNVFSVDKEYIMNNNPKNDYYKLFLQEFSVSIPLFINQDNNLTSSEISNISQHFDYDVFTDMSNVGTIRYDGYCFYHEDNVLPYVYQIYNLEGRLVFDSEKE